MEICQAVCTLSESPAYTPSDFARIAIVFGGPVAVAHFDCVDGILQVGLCVSTLSAGGLMSDRSFEAHGDFSVCTQPTCEAVLVVLIASLTFLSGCSSSSPKCPSFSGSFTNTSLGPMGTQWAYELSGWILKSSGVYTPYTAAGIFIVDGNGNITGGSDAYWGTIVSGTYSVTSNGKGAINLNTANQTGTQSLIWGVTVANSWTTNGPGLLAVIELDTFANSRGVAYQQNAATLNT